MFTSSQLYILVGIGFVFCLIIPLITWSQRRSERILANAAAESQTLELDVFPRELREHGEWILWRVISTEDTPRLIQNQAREVVARVVDDRLEGGSAVGDFDPHPLRAWTGRLKDWTFRIGDWTVTVHGPGLMESSLRARIVGRDQELTLDHQSLFDADRAVAKYVEVGGLKTLFLFEAQIPDSLKIVVTYVAEFWRAEVLRMTD